MPMCETQLMDEYFAGVSGSLLVFLLIILHLIVARLDTK